MKTAGALLKERRLAKELSLQTVSTKTKIKLEYLQALEDSDFSKLPSPTFTKGFLRNYAEYLYLNPDTILAMFRRDFTQNTNAQIVPRGLIHPVNTKPRLFSINTILITCATLIFVGFLTIQLVSWRRLPKLTVLQPQNGDTYGEKITVKGVSDRDATVSVDGQLVIVGNSGEFSIDMVFGSGTHAIVISAKNREGRSRSVERTFTVSK